MSHLDPVIDAADHYDALHAYSDAMRDAEAVIELEILQLVAAGDMSAAVYSAPLVDQRKFTLAGMMVSKRFQTLDEVLFDSLDMTDGPTFAEIMGLLCKVPEAKPLFNRMAQKFASINSYVDTS